MWCYINIHQIIVTLLFCVTKCYKMSWKKCVTKCLTYYIFKNPSPPPKYFILKIKNSPPHPKKKKKKFILKLSPKFMWLLLPV
ncbi:hypothetical protein HanIR_Chr04g0168841 [Helianthus annuus]|nr:hypothetical protein HanIR_Chr04g0168841 [Helianthus annuus]